jgi:hypothetical protein
MLPLGVALVTSAAVGLVSRVLPRWLAWVGLVVGLTALVNGTLLGSEGAWGFLIGIIWVFTGGTVPRCAAPAQCGTAAGHHRQLTPPQPDYPRAAGPGSPPWARSAAGRSNTEPGGRIEVRRVPTPLTRATRLPFELG